MTTNYPLTIEEFKTWLESKDKKDIVGFSTIPEFCPIANCLRKKLSLDKNKKVVVGRETVIEKAVFSNPSWVQQFVSKVDDFYVFPTVITVEQAIKAMIELDL